MSVAHTCSQLSRVFTISRLTFFSAAFSGLLSIHNFMLKAAQTKWISRLVAKMNIQEALMEFDQQLRDAAMSFQVRRQTALLILGAMKLNVGEIRSPH